MDDYNHLNSALGSQQDAFDWMFQDTLVSWNNYQLQENTAVRSMNLYYNEIAPVATSLGNKLPDATKAFLSQASQALGTTFDPDDPASLIGKLGGMSKMIGATTQHTANPTGMRAGYKVNVIPQKAEGELDGRFLPGREEEFYAEIDRLLGPGVSREFIHHDVALETTADGALWDAMSASLLAEDPEGTVVPYCLSAGTDAKHFSKLGVRCFGFSTGGLSEAE